MWLKYKTPVLFIIAFSLGIAITIIDSSPTWDDTGVTAVMIFGLTATLGFISPKRPWIWAMLVSLWIPVYGILSTQNFGSLLALVFGFAGAYGGAFIRKSISKP